MYKIRHPDLGWYPFEEGRPKGVMFLTKKKAMRVLVRVRKAWEPDRIAFMPSSFRVVKVNRKTGREIPWSEI